MAERKLSDDEVKALLEGLGDGLMDVEAISQPAISYKKYDLGADDVSVLGDLYTLRVINERFGRQIRNLLQSMLRFAPRIGTLPPKIIKFGEYLAGLDTFVSLTTLRIDALKGSALVTLPPRLISILVNRFYGGSNEDVPLTHSSEFTATEERIIQITLDGIISTLDDSWRDVYPAVFEFTNSETNSGFLSFVDEGDQIVICDFVIQLPFAKQCVVDIVYPLNMLKQIGPMLRSKVQRTGANLDENWRQRLRDAVLEVPLEFAPRVAEPVMTIAQLLSVKPGFTMPIETFVEIPVYINGNPVYMAKMGEQNGKMAVSIV